MQDRPFKEMAQEADFVPNLAKKMREVYDDPKTKPEVKERILKTS